MYLPKNSRWLFQDGTRFFKPTSVRGTTFSDGVLRKTVKPEGAEFGATILPSDVAGTNYVLEKGTSGEVKKNVPLDSCRAEILVNADPYEDIPGPQVFRSFSEFLKNAARSLTVCFLLRLLKKNSITLFRKYGPMVKLPEFFGGKILVVYKPEQVAAVFQADGRRAGISSSFDSVERCRSRKGAERLTLVAGDSWEKVKKIVKVPPIKDETNKYRQIQNFAVRFSEKIRLSRSKRNETPHDFLLEINKWSLECLCFVLFGKTWGFLDAEKMSRPSKPARFLKDFVETTDRVSECESGLQLWRFLDTLELETLKKSCVALEKTLLENVRQSQLSLAKKMERTKDSDFVVGDFFAAEEMLLREDSTPEDVTVAAFDFLLAGANAASSALSFFIYHAAEKSVVQENIFAEAERILPRVDGTLSRDDLISMKYLRGCLNESLRLKMPRPVAAKVLSEDAVLSDYRVPRATCVVMARQIEGLKEENFEKATEFRPERWSDEDLELPLSYFPPLGNQFFGALERRSVEEAIQLCIVHILRRYRVEYNYEPINATYSVISLPDKPLRFTFTERD